MNDILGLGTIIAIAAAAIFFIALIVTICVVIKRLRNKIRGVSRAAFRTDSFIEGVKKQELEYASTPKSLSAMTSIYLPKIQRDFPSFNYACYKLECENVVRGYLSALTGDTGALPRDIRLAADRFLEDLRKDKRSISIRGVQLHRTEISGYIKSGGTVRIIFQTSAGFYRDIKDQNGEIIKGSETVCTQTIFETQLLYVQNAEKAGDTARGVSCPNCGAPVTTLGDKVCPYCGSAVEEINSRVWTFCDIAEKHR